MRAACLCLGDPISRENAAILVSGIRVLLPAVDHSVLDYGKPLLCCAGIGWKIAGAIGRDRSFSVENANLLKRIAVLAVTDTGFFFVNKKPMFEIVITLTPLD